MYFRRFSHLSPSVLQSFRSSGRPAKNVPLWSLPFFSSSTELSAKTDTVSRVYYPTRDLRARQGVNTILTPRAFRANWSAWLPMLARVGLTSTAASRRGRLAGWKGLQLVANFIEFTHSPVKYRRFSTN